MPEYLAPSVYVEEVDTGNKPIEGVSTSTAGMLGVTERGPVNVPILVTSYGEYVRWFGERLQPDIYSNGTDRHCYLPHAIEGFFVNGGKRVFVTRVLELEAASLAQTPLFLHEEQVPTGTLLTRAASTASSVLFVWPATPGAINTNEWVRIGRGSDAEYRQAAAPPAAATTSIVASLPLQRSHAVVANNVEHYVALPVVAAPRKLEGAHRAGATTLALTGGGGVVDGRLLQVRRTGPPATNEELIYIRSAVDLGSGNWRVELDTPLQLDHIHGEEANVLSALPAPLLADVTQLTRAAVGGDTTLIVTSNTTFATGFLRVVEGTRGEFRRIGAIHAVTFGVPVTNAIAGGTYVDRVQRADNMTITVPIKTLDEPVGGGVMALPLNNRQGLQIGQVLRVGAANDPDVEYVVIRDLPNPAGSGPDPGRVVLEAPLARAHGGATVASRQVVAVQTIAVQAEAATVLHELSTGSTSGFVTAALLAALTLNDLMRVVAPGAAPSYLRLTGHDPRIVQALSLTAPLLQPHAAPQPLVERRQLMTVFALDPGVWGNRLQIAARRETTPLVRTRIRNDPSGIQDPTHIRLDSAAGVEAGAVLSLADANGAPVDAPFKIEGVDRQNGYLLALNTPLPAAAALGSAIVSIEFSLSAYLLRQPDPAQPSRNNQVIDSETFRHLSLDDRHSRYIHKIIGTTFSLAPGTTHDDDGRPLRLSDRRSEGESSYIRVRDIAQDLPDPPSPPPNRVPQLRSIRLGPEFLIDVINGREEAARRTLTDGDDQIGALTSLNYIGTDNPDPDRRTGLQAFRNIEEISILGAPGQVSAQIQSALISHCELMRYRFVVLDGPRPPQDALSDVQTQRQQFDTKYAALYHPWLLIPEPYPLSVSLISDYPVPPSGHVLGIYARTDIERGVHKAPANEVVRGILGLQRVLNKEQHDILNPYPVNINVIRDFRDNNRGIRVYGGRVITSDSDWKYVNVRRLLIFIEASIDRGLQWVVFEPNAEPLWARVRRSISNFLTLVWRNGGLEGTKVEEAYFVKCDRTTMTQTDLDSGRLICLVGVAPVKPAEFVIVRIGLWTARTNE
jgi:hypothetical protein